MRVTPEKKEQIEKLNPGRQPLSEMKTRELLALRNHCYSTGGWYSPYDSSGPGYHIEEVLDELDTREHIPNKLEARNIRRAKHIRKQKRILKYTK
jgi:hypothetical protein